MTYDALIVGGGPAGLSAALNLGRARRRVLLCDAGERRNAAAEHIHGFVTRDGTPPVEFRGIARQQLERYPNVEVRDTRVEAIEGTAGAFDVRLATGRVSARRILLCTGMIDVLPAIDGFRALWGRSIFQCPYCHGWEVQDQRFGFLAQDPDKLGFPLLLRGWSSDVTLYTDARVVVPDPLRAQLSAAGVAIETRPIARLVAGSDGRLAAVELAGGESRPCQVLFAHPPQRQVPLVASLGLALDPGGYVAVRAMHHETSIPGIYAAGDLATPGQAVTIAAAAGMMAAAALNYSLVSELAVAGALP